MTRLALVALGLENIMTAAGWHAQSFPALAPDPATQDRSGRPRVAGLVPDATTTACPVYYPREAAAPPMPPTRRSP